MLHSAFAVITSATSLTRCLDAEVQVRPSLTAVSCVHNPPPPKHVDSDPVPVSVGSISWLVSSDSSCTHLTPSVLAILLRPLRASLLRKAAISLPFRTVFAPAPRTFRQRGELSANMSTRTTRSRAAKQSTLPSPPHEVKDEPQQLSSPPTAPMPAKGGAAKLSKAKTPKAAAPKKEPITPNTSRKRTRSSLKEEEDDADELPHNLGTFNSDETPDDAVKPSRKKRSRKTSDLKAPLKLDDPEVKAMAAKVTTPSDSSSAKKAKKSKDKANNYGLAPGVDPYPDWPHPTAEECYEMNRLLSAAHGAVKAPKTIPLPSLEVSGCGEVPSVLDALIRTRLSAATSGANSSRAFKGLVERFGIIKTGVGKGSVDWDAVRRADLKEVYDAIKSGGLADVKSKDIKKILEMVYEENQARREGLVAAAQSKDTAKAPLGAENESKEEKTEEIERADEGVISLDHLHLLSTDDAFAALTKYPGIGPKTASCVLLFCLQRPSFAVDTHVFRLCKWLGWVPPDKATRNSTYAHCEVRVPDELKYPLHQLLIRHGKGCGRCRANTGPGSEGWSRGCPIDHLVKRSGARKGGGTAAKSAKAKKARKRADSEEAESSELSELESEGLESVDDVSEDGGEAEE